MEITGGCLCRAVRYRISAPPLITRVCWCRVLPVMHRRFCPKCGTPMFSEAEARPTLIFVRAGTLDDPEVAEPAMTIWTSSAPSWACINADLPRAAAQPPPVS
jgi:hypothetical protein